MTVSLIGMLEQFSLASVLQRVEAHEKTGLLTIKQGAQSVELYLREGRLLSLGPIRTIATLGERLLQDGVISQQAFQEIRRVLGPEEASETRVALTLMERKFVSREELRTWAIQKTVDVLKILLPWSAGEIHFTEDAPPPPDRLLVSMSISSLLESANSAAPQTQPQTAVQTGRVAAVSRAQDADMTPPRIAVSGPLPSAPSIPDVANVAARTSSEPLFDASAFNDSPFAQSLLSSTSGSLPIFSADDAISSPASMISGADLLSASPMSAINPSFAPQMSSVNTPAPAPLQPVPAVSPTPPKRIDTSFMRPEMILMPADLSALRDRNIPVHLTPDQWRLLTRVDGKTTLQMACQDLAMVPELLCQVAGELIAEGLIYLTTPGPQPQTYELSSMSRELAASGLGNGYVAPGYAAMTAPPWSSAVPAPSVPVPPVMAPDAQSQFSSPLQFETESQWGNGGNGATFVPGRGWIASPQPLQPLQPGGPLGSHSGIYAQVGGIGN